MLSYGSTDSNFALHTSEPSIVESVGCHNPALGLHQCFEPRGCSTHCSFNTSNETRGAPPSSMHPSLAAFSRSLADLASHRSCNQIRSEYMWKYDLKFAKPGNRAHHFLLVLLFYPMLEAHQLEFFAPYPAVGDPLALRRACPRRTKLWQWFSSSTNCCGSDIFAWIRLKQLAKTLHATASWGAF